MKRITDKDFKYVPSSKTDLRKTFARVRREQREKERENNKVIPLPITKREEQ